MTSAGPRLLGPADVRRLAAELDIPKRDVYARALALAKKDG